MIKYIIDGKFYDPILMGDVGDFDEDCDKDCTCHDCGCKVGEIHNERCDAQRCPCCNDQFISCNCNIFVYDTETKKKHFVDKTIYYKLMGNIDKLIETERIKKRLEEDEMN